MKYSDVKMIHEAGLITAEQEQAIVQHFNLKEHDNRLLAILSVFGGLLVFCGIALLIAANWDEIPRGLKIFTGLALLIGTHAAGWYLREGRGFPKTGEALHLAGSCLFLANIALIGQVYNLSSRPPNAFLLWFIGIAALPWILRSVSQHLLTLIAFGIWFGMELNDRAGWMYFGDEEQVLLYVLLALAYLGGAYLLRLGRHRAFARPTESLALLAMHVFLYPTTWGLLRIGNGSSEGLQRWILPVFVLLALAAVVAGGWNLDSLRPGWRVAWTGALAGWVLLCGAVFLLPEPADYSGGRGPLRWLFTAALFSFCLLEIQVGIQRRLPGLVNLGVTFMALTILSAYINLFGSMARTGVMFLFAGVFLIVFGIVLEKKRRAWTREALTLRGPEVS